MPISERRLIPEILLTISHANKAENTFCELIVKITEMMFNENCRQVEEMSLEWSLTAVTILQLVKKKKQQ